MDAISLKYTARHGLISVKCGEKEIALMIQLPNSVAIISSDFAFPKTAVFNCREAVDAYLIALAFEAD